MKICSEIHLGPKFPVLLLVGHKHRIENLDADSPILIHTTRIYIRALTIYGGRAVALTRVLTNGSVKSMMEAGVCVGERSERVTIVVALVNYSESSKTGLDFGEWGRKAREVRPRKGE
jgi:hypothetical protein